MIVVSILLTHFWHYDGLKIHIFTCNFFFVSHFFSVEMNKAIVFEEQEGDYKVHFEDTPDLGMAADIQWMSYLPVWALFFV